MSPDASLLADSKRPRHPCGVRNTHRELTAVIEIDDGLCWPLPKVLESPSRRPFL